MALPEAQEILTWGEHPTFRVRGRIFAIAGEGLDRVSIKATPDVQADLIYLDPELIQPLLVDAWRMTAPKGLR